MAQTERVLAHLQRRGYITPLVARNYGIERLTSRIYDLRKQGHTITAEYKRDDAGRRYTEYRLG
ncbi:helix-turn-helix domain-containing protein [Roseomonas sp. GC11]|uniref:helix-turn-helix domain-containing protein n=1 Tax=Roseomonas sp. GC11 TaxID=2950546 RepID=UPI00210C5459|nr:helix-turn-helix domain-containing protein [Roseomonas sp. GC11]MCQ4158780.1 helix-turn-helix domain-containing protein [Roseomonas sp. GC11]